MNEHLVKYDIVDSGKSKNNKCRLFSSSKWKRLRDASRRKRKNLNENKCRRSEEIRSIWKGKTKD